MSDASPVGGLGLLEDTSTQVQPDTPWQTVLSNDPVNSFPYVIAQMQRILKISREKAENLTLRVHHEGSAAVFHGEKDKCEQYAAEFSAAHLWSRAERTQ